MRTSLNFAGRMLLDATLQKRSVLPQTKTACKPTKFDGFWDTPSFQVCIPGSDSSKTCCRVASRTLFFINGALYCGHMLWTYQGWNPPLSVQKGHYSRPLTLTMSWVMMTKRGLFLFRSIRQARPMHVQWTKRASEHQLAFSIANIKYQTLQKILFNAFSLLAFTFLMVLLEVLTEKWKNATVQTFPNLSPKTKPFETKRCPKRTNQWSDNIFRTARLSPPLKGCPQVTTWAAGQSKQKAPGFAFTEILSKPAGWLMYTFLPLYRIFIPITFQVRSYLAWNSLHNYYLVPLFQSSKPFTSSYPKPRQNPSNTKPIVPHPAPAWPSLRKAQKAPLEAWTSKTSKSWSRTSERRRWMAEEQNSFQTKWFHQNLGNKTSWYRNLKPPEGLAMVV